MPPDIGGRSIANDPAVKEIAKLLAGDADEESTIHNNSDPGEEGSDSERNSAGDVAESDAGDADGDMEESTEGDQDGDAAASDGDSAGDGVTIAQLAERLGIKPADIYNDLLIPMPHAEPITLGQFKDRVQELANLDGERDKFTEKQNEYEKSQMRDRALLREMLEIIGPDNARPALAAAEKRLASWNDSQKKEILLAIPEWKDSATIARDRDQIVAMGAEYGFSESEMIYTQDARTVRMLRDFAKLRERHAKPELNGKIQRVAPGKPGAKSISRRRNALAQALSAAKSSPNNAVKAKGVAALLEAN